MPLSFPWERRTFLETLGAVSAAATFAPHTLFAAVPADWTAAFPPHRIFGNLYYVGSQDLASFLFTTAEGHILINSSLVTSPALIRASVEKLGFHWKDVKILLISHAHYDHCAGSPQILKETGAQYMVMDADVADVADGGRSNFHYASDRDMLYTPCKVDRVLRNEEKVTLAGVTLTAHKTAGHTKGCTTWTSQLSSDGLTLDAVIVGSPNVNPGYKLVRNAQYPQIAADFARQFQTLKALPCDLFLGAHGGYYDMEEKYRAMQAGKKQAFVDPTGYKAYIADRQQAFEKELAKQQSRKKAV